SPTCRVSDLTRAPSLASSLVTNAPSSLESATTTICSTNFSSFKLDDRTFSAGSAPALNVPNGAWDGIVEDYLIVFHDVKTFFSYLRCNEHVECARPEVIQHHRLFFLCQATVVSARSLADESNG